MKGGEIARGSCPLRRQGDNDAVGQWGLVVQPAQALGLVRRHGGDGRDIDHCSVPSGHRTLPNMSSILTVPGFSSAWALRSSSAGSSIT